MFDTLYLYHELRPIEKRRPRSFAIVIGHACKTYLFPLFCICFGLPCFLWTSLTAGFLQNQWCAKNQCRARLPSKSWWCAKSAQLPAFKICANIYPKICTTILHQNLAPKIAAEICANKEGMCRKKLRKKTKASAAKKCRKKKGKRRKKKRQVPQKKKASAAKNCANMLPRFSIVFQCFWTFLWRETDFVARF